MKEIYFSQAINRGIRQELIKNPKIFLIGEDIGIMDGSFNVTAGLLAEFGPERILDTPISEQTIVGMSTGAASTGMVPVAEIMYNDFMGCCADLIMNQAAKFRYMYGGKMKVPMVIRMTCGAGVQCAAQHSQCLEALLTHIPGLKVVYPSTAADAQGLIVASIRDENPVMFFEHVMLYGEKENVPDEIEPIALGKGDIKVKGSDVTVIATGLCVRKAMAAAKELEKDNISVEVIDPRTLYPLDKEMIYKSVAKTGKVVIVTEEVKRGAWSGELAACIVEDMFESLKNKIVRIGTLNVPIPATKILEDYVIPQTNDIVKGVHSLF